MLNPSSMNEINEIIVLGGVFAAGMLGTVVYCFARFFMFSDSEKSEKKATQKSLTEALKNSRKSLWSKGNQDLNSLEDFEESLYMADLGPQTVNFLTERVNENLKGKSFDLQEVKNIFKEEMFKIFETDEGPNRFEYLMGKKDFQTPYVIAIVGVNGAGKTTTIGKLAYHFSRTGKKVMVAAGDTFRAAAGEQLKVWAEKSQTLLFSGSEQTKDPGAVAYQAYEKAIKEKVDILLIDTAGRLHTQENLMSELEKVKRVLSKKDPGLPQDVWMILDSNTGTNALHQAQAFHQILKLTGVIMTKVDGSSKAGTALGVKHSLGVPILILGTGEKMEDLKVFDAKEFIESLV